MRLDEIVGKVAIQSIPCSFGAMLARKQLGGGESDADEIQAERTAGYAGQLFLMLAGALFLAFNVSPTEEMMLIELHDVAVADAAARPALDPAARRLRLSASASPASASGAESVHRASHFLRFSLAGYGIAMLVSLYVLWTFGRTDGGRAQPDRRSPSPCWPSRRRSAPRSRGWWFEGERDGRSPQVRTSRRGSRCSNGSPPASAWSSPSA